MARRVLSVSINRVGRRPFGPIVEADQVMPPSTPGSGDTGRCAGKTITGKKIMYRSKPGFRGSDTVGYDSDGNGTIIHTTIAVTVE